MFNHSIEEMHFCALLLIVGAAVAQDFITVYADADMEGQSEAVPLGGCTNLGMNDMVTSVNTHGLCAYLCQDAGCAGRCIKLQPDCGWPDCCPNHSNIGIDQCDFNDQASSVKGC